MKKIPHALLLLLLLVQVGLSQLSFDGARHQHVSHGTFYKVYDGTPSTYLANEFTVDAWVRIDPATRLGYIVSAGYGGAHAVLFGVQGDGSTYALTGNVNSLQPDGSVGLISFSSPAIIPARTWHQVTVELTHGFICTYIDGTRQSATPFTGQRVAASAFSDPLGGELFVGGSDHLNFSGLIGQIRIFEGIGIYQGFNFPVEYSLRDVKTRLSNGEAAVTVGSNLLADYSKCGSIVTDESAGYNGTRHPGALYSAMGGLVSTRNAFLPLPQCVFDSSYPIRSPGLETTAANVSLTGRVRTADGRPIARAYVSVIDSPVRVLTNALGYYKLDKLVAGHSYVISADARHHTFESRVVTPYDPVVGFDFVAR